MLSGSQGNARWYRHPSGLSFRFGLWFSLLFCVLESGLIKSLPHERRKDGKVPNKFPSLMETTGLLLNDPDRDKSIRWARTITLFARAEKTMTFGGGNSWACHDQRCPEGACWLRMTYGPCRDTGSRPIVVSDTQQSEEQAHNGRRSSGRCPQRAYRPIDHQAMYSAQMW